MTDNNTPHQPHETNIIISTESPKSVFISYLLLILGGGLGIHKFYLGQIKWGIAYLLTGGILGIGILYDIFTLSAQTKNSNMRNQLLLHQSSITSATPERQILTVLSNANGKQLFLTDIILNTQLSSEQIEAELDALVHKGLVSMDINKDGKMIYYIA